MGKSRTFTVEMDGREPVRRTMMRHNEYRADGDDVTRYARIMGGEKPGKKGRTFTAYREPVYYSGPGGVAEIIGASWSDDVRDEAYVTLYRNNLLKALSYDGDPDYIDRFSMKIHEDY